MTSGYQTLSYRHFERQREIFVICGRADDARETLGAREFQAPLLYICGEAALTRSTR